ncbi:MAG: formamidopyrimidine-DNA glycosylase [Acidimicrobiia bacterium]
MPELPEVETLRRDLEREVTGKRIKAVEVRGTRPIRRHPSAEQFVGRLVGRRVTGVGRRGKYLLVRLDGDEVLVVHLGMSGRLLRAKSAKEPLPRHTHVVITFTTGAQLRYVDPRTFGELFVVAAPDEVPELAHLGFDALEHSMSWVTFGEMLRSRRTKLKTLLMDQRFMAGIGNIYADEILFAAGLRHNRMSDSLSAQEVRRLYRAISETLQDAIRHRGSTLADRQYRDLFGEAGEYQGQHNVYDREGQPCRRCRAPVVRERTGGRSTFFCAHCQV